MSRSLPPVPPPRSTLLVRASGALALLSVLLSWGASPLRGQELRLSVVGGHSRVDEIGFAGGIGAGLRVFPFRGIGAGLDFDRLGSSPTVAGVTCAPGSQGGDCLQEQVTMDTRADLTSFLLMARGRGEEWGIRIGIGRTAGSVTSHGTGRESGREFDVPPADTGAGPVAWSRGADGSVIVVELLRTLPVPGPFPVDVHAGFRHYGLRMEGCVTGEHSPFCASRAITTLQAGLHVGLWPRGAPESETVRR